MRKTMFMCLLMAIVSMMATGCSSCQSEKNKQEQAVSLVPENCISTDREALFVRTAHGDVLHWMQTGVVFSKFLTDEDASEAEVVEVTDGFQTETKTERGYKTKVTLITTGTEATDSLVMDGSFWFDNYPLDDKEINLSFKEAVEKALEANCPKPQTKCCVLRSPVGSVHVDDAYYIFYDGSEAGVFIFVNARTGEVTTESPAYPKPSV